MFNVLMKLMVGVLRFKNEPFEQMRLIFKQLSEGQNPDVFFITCSDSRVDQNLITQSGPGNLFVTKNVGNIIPPNTLSSEAAAIEYALKVLHVKDIIVCGHSDCGAMKGLLTPSLENDLPATYAWLAHSRSVLDDIEKHPDFTDDFTIKLKLATKQNVLTQIEHLKTYPIVAEKLARNELTIHGWYYDIGSGKIYIYDSQVKDFISLKIALGQVIEIRKNDIVKDISMNYLAQFMQPKTAHDYQTLMSLLTHLKDDLNAIWQQIKEPVSQSLWAELGKLYSSPSDPEFTTLVEGSIRVKLDKLRDFQKNIQESKGYHQHCSQLIRQFGILKPMSPSKIPQVIYTDCNTAPSILFNMNSG